MNTFRPEFTSGLDAFTKFVFDRTRPKQLGASTMTGPILAGLTQSFLDAINTGAVPTISSSWQVCPNWWRHYDLCLMLILCINRTTNCRYCLQFNYDNAIEKHTCSAVYNLNCFLPLYPIPIHKHLKSFNCCRAHLQQVIFGGNGVCFISTRFLCHYKYPLVIMMLWMACCEFIT